MRFRSLFGLTFTVLGFTALADQSLAGPDPNYVKHFGWGKVVISDKGYPTYDTCDMSMFQIKDNAFQITTGKDKTLAVRFLLKDNKTYGHYLANLKKAQAAKAKTRKEDYIRTLFYVSHDASGKQLFTTWPAAMSELPKWHSIGEFQTNLNDTAKTWNGSAITWDEIKRDVNKLADWLTAARPGYKIYVVHVAGFLRDAPELKYWDKSLLKWMVPVEYVDTEPLAVGVANVTGSTNPLLSWSNMVVSMPSTLDDNSWGELTVLKDGTKYTTFKFAIKVNYTNQVTGQTVYDFRFRKEDDQLIGGFQAEAKTVDKALENAFYDAIERALSMEYIK